MDANDGYQALTLLTQSFPDDHVILSYMPTKPDPTYHVKVQFSKGLPVSKMSRLLEITELLKPKEFAEFDMSSDGLELHLR